MAFCSKCGGRVDDGAAFCSHCGQPMSSAAPSPSGSSTPAASGSNTGLTENVASGLCYVLGWVTGLVFFLIDKRPAVRFHAAQSMVVFGGLHVITFGLGIIFGAGMFFGGFAGFSAGWLLLRIVDLLAVILWIVCMVQAFQGHRFEVPIAAGIAENLAKS